MRLRSGFVSNSSSASFILQKKKMSGELMDQVRLFFEQWAANERPEEEWYFSETSDSFTGHTCMDNGILAAQLHDVINTPLIWTREG